MPVNVTITTCTSVATATYIDGPTGGANSAAATRERTTSTHMSVVAGIMS